MTEVAQDGSNPPVDASFCFTFAAFLAHMTLVIVATRILFHGVVFFFF